MDLMMILGIAGIFGALFIGLASIGAFSSEVRGVGKSLSAIDAFTSAPKQMQQEADPGFNERILVPTLDRLSRLGKRFSPSDNADRMRQRIEMAGSPAGWTVDRIASLKLLGAGGGIALGIVIVLLFGTSLLVSVVLVVATALAGYMAPNLYLYQLGYDRNNKIQRALPDALDLLTISVESGLGFDAALSQVARNTSGPLASEFARVLQEMQIGMGRGAAMRALGERTHVVELKGFVSAMVQADALGIPIGQVLRVQSAEIRVKRRQSAEEQAQKVAVKIMVPLVFLILPCLFIAVLGPAAIGIMDAFSSKL
jgi:tight adherence protein C